MKNRCCLLCRWEFHPSRLCLAHNDWRAFIFTPWLPYRWYYQMFYVIYRWVVSLYFGGYLFAYGAIFNTSSYLIYLTNWSFIMLNVHFLYSALTTTVEYFKVYLCCRRHFNDLHFERDADEFSIVPPKGCFNREYNQIKWYHMIQWVLFILGAQAAVCVVILYWTLIFGGGDVTLYDGHAHLGNGLIGLVDLFVSGFPVRFLHFYMIQMYAATYASFTGIYYAAGGTGNNGTSYIYPPLNYAERPGFAAGLVIGVLILLPLLHFAFYGVYVCRYWLIYVIYGRRRQANHSSRAVEMSDNGLNSNYAANKTLGMADMEY